MEIQTRGFGGVKYGTKETYPVTNEKEVTSQSL
jgi:hypothetical protein